MVLLPFGDMLMPKSKFTTLLASCAIASLALGGCAAQEGLRQLPESNFVSMQEGPGEGTQAQVAVVAVPACASGGGGEGGKGGRGRDDVAPRAGREGG